MKYDHLHKGFFCFLLAFFIVSLLFTFAFPNNAYEEAISCKLALQQFLENPEIYVPTDNLKITIADSSITASKHFSFVYSTAIFQSDGTYEIETGIRLFQFLFFNLILFVILVLLTSILLNVLASFLASLCKKIFAWLNTFFRFIQKKFVKVLDYFHRKRLQRSLKEYDNPEYIRIYNIGYNKGYADGLAERNIGPDQFDPNI